MNKLIFIFALFIFSCNDPDYSIYGDWRFHSVEIYGYVYTGDCTYNVPGNYYYSIENFDLFIGDKIIVTFNCFQYSYSAYWLKRGNYFDIISGPSVTKTEIVLLSNNTLVLRFLDLPYQPLFKFTR